MRLVRVLAVFVLVGAAAFAGWQAKQRIDYLEGEYAVAAYCNGYRDAWHAMSTRMALISPQGVVNAYESCFRFYLEESPEYVAEVKEKAGYLGIPEAADGISTDK